MTMRERLIAVLRGGPVDRVPFVQYDGCAGSTEEIWSVVGRENMGVLRWTSAHSTHAPNCRFEQRPIVRGERHGAITTMHTPAGSLEQEVLFQPDLGCSATRKHYVREPNDYDILLAYLRDIEIVPSPETVDQVIADLSDDGLPHVSVDRTPFQQMWIQWVCIEDLSYHLVDCPDRVHACMEAIARNVRRECEIAAQSNAPYIVFPDNITAPVIGDRLFREHCVPFYRELADMLTDGGVPVFVHMDGDLAALHSAIGESGIRGIDSLSPPPDNDTSVETARRLWPTMRLFVNYPSSVHLASEQAVYDQTVRILEEDGNSGLLEIQISENVPPGAWRRTFPAIIRAIADHSG